MDSKLKGLADRLKSKIEGSSQALASTDDLTDLVDAHLDLVSAAHGSAHGSGHGSGHRSGSQQLEEGLN